MGAIVMTKADWEEMWRVINCLDRQDIPEFSNRTWHAFTYGGGRHLYMLTTDDAESDLIWAAAMRRHQRSRAAMEDA